MRDFSPVANVTVISISALAAVVGAWFMSKRRPGLTLATVHRDLPLLLVSLAAWTVAIVVMFYIGITISPVFDNVPVWFVSVSLPLAWLMLHGLFAFAFGFAVILSFMEVARQRRQLALAAVLLVIAMQLAQWQYHRPIAHELVHEATHDGVVLQSSAASCMAATGANIAAGLGITVTEPDMARLMGTGPMGTSVSQFIRGMAEVGVHCIPIFVDDLDVAKLSTPAELRVLHLGEPHAVAFMGISEGRAEVLDPLKGRVFYSRDELRNVWTGGALECRLSGNK